MPSSEEIYVRELLVLGKGLPIWDPEPPIPHGEVHIGDVGYFWQGAFYRFFNTMSSVEENEEDGCEVPTPFTQLEMPKNAFRVDDPCAIQANAPLCSRTIKAYHLDGGSDIDHLVHGHFSVKSEQKEGAILVINSNAERHAYHDNIWMKQYVIKNVKHWKQFALKNKGIELDYDEIYFVRGVVKTKSWTVAAFHEGSESFEGQLSLHHSPVGLHAAVKWSSEKYCCPDYLSGPRRLASPEASLANSSTDFNRLSAQYTSLVANDGSPFNSVMLPGRPRGPPKKRRRRNGHTTPGPESASHERLGSQIKPEIGDYSDLSRQESQYDTSRNQCIFLHYYKVKRRLVGPKVIKAAAEPQDLSLDNSSDDSEIAIHLLADNADLGEVVMEDMLPRKFHDPVDDILEYILTTSTAEIAIASDADVFALCANNNPPRSFNIVLQERSPRVEVDSDGVGVVVPLFQQSQLLQWQLQHQEDAQQQSRVANMDAQLGPIQNFQAQQTSFLPISTMQDSADAMYQGSHQIMQSSSMLNTGDQRSMAQPLSMQQGIPQQQQPHPQQPQQQDQWMPPDDMLRNWQHEQLQHTPQIPQKVATPQLMPQVTTQMGLMPPWTVSTPLQINQPQASPNVMAAQFASQMYGPAQQAPMRFPPLTQDVFNQAYRNWCTRNNVNPDPSQLNRDGRQINLYVLHQEVMNMGTYGMIASNDDAWAILGGKLGFVQFPASSESEPAKSGPDMAAHLHHVYKEYLHGFDAAYITSILRRRQEQQQEQQQRSQGAQPPSMQNIPQNSDQERRMQMMSQMQNAPMSGLPQYALVPGLPTQPINTHQATSMQRPGMNGLPNLSGMDLVQIPPIQQRRWPTTQERQQGADLVARIKSESMGPISAMQMNNIPDHQRFEFNTLFEQVYKFSQEIEPSLHRFACFWKPETIHHIVIMVLATEHQQHLLTMTPPRYCLEVHTVRTMAKHFQTALEQFNFASFVDDAGSQAATPDLTPASSANPSPMVIVDYDHAPSVAADITQIMYPNVDEGVQGPEVEENSDLITTQISHTLDRFPPGFIIPSDGVEDSLSSLTGARPSDFSSSIFCGPSLLPSSLPGLDGSEYFDFSLYEGTEDNADYEGWMPDLIRVSTFTSPSSQSETDPSLAPSTAADTAKIMDPNVDEGGQGLDFLRGSLSEEIDGGEPSADDYASDDWKWDTPMALLDQAWTKSP